MTRYLKAFYAGWVGLFRMLDLVSNGHVSFSKLLCAGFAIHMVAHNDVTFAKMTAVLAAGFGRSAFMGWINRTTVTATVEDKTNRQEIVQRRESDFEPTP